MLLAEHEPEVAEMAARYLRRDGLGVRLAATADLALAGLADGPDAMAVVDLTMPGLDAGRVRRAVGDRSVYAGLPGRRSPAAARWPDRADGRPPLAGPPVQSPGCSWRWLRTCSPNPTPGRCAPRPQFAGLLRLDGARRTLAVSGREVPLTATEFAILAFMMDNPGRALTRRQLLAAADYAIATSPNGAAARSGTVVGAGGSPSASARAGAAPGIRGGTVSGAIGSAGRAVAADRAADVYITQLRAKLGPAASIRTVRGVGYALDLALAAGRASGASRALCGASRGAGVRRGGRAPERAGTGVRSAAGGLPARGGRASGAITLARHVRVNSRHVLANSGGQ